MKLEIQIDDDVYKEYQRQAGRRRTSVAALLAEQVARFKDFNTTDRVFVVTPPVRERLEEIFARQLQGDAALVELVERLASIKLGEVRVEATPQQLEELQRYAEKSGKTFEEVCQERFREVAKGFFHNW